MPKKCYDRASKQYILDRIRVDEDGCWLWTSSVNPKTGYGQIGYPPYTAHRLAFFLWNGRFPNGVTRHQCESKACCNPEHLIEGTQKENHQDSRDRHEAGYRRLRGRVAHNAQPVVIHGVAYPSKDAACKALRVGFYTVSRLVAEQAA